MIYRMISDAIGWRKPSWISATGCSAPLFQKMVERVGRVIEEKADSVRIYAICAGCEKNIQILGQGEVSREEDIYIV